MSDERGQIPRNLLAKYFGKDPRLVRAFENQALAVLALSDGVVAATGALDQASVVTLSSNEGFSNEYVLQPGDGTKIELGPGTVALSVDDSVARASNYKVRFVPPGNVTLGLPPEGTLLSDAAPASLRKPSMTGLVNAANDAAASSAGVPIGGIYHNAGALRIRLV